MQVRAEQINEHLKLGLKPVYLISGDEPLQVMEVADAVRSYAREHGFAERDILTVDNQFDWNVLLEASSALSLFAEKKLLDMRLGSSKIGTAGSKAMQHYLQNPPDDKVLLIQSPRLDKSVRNAAWVKAINQQGVLITVWELSAAQTEAWVARRLRSAGVQADEDAVRYLAERVEGNLLAAAQEINKLQLLQSGAVLDVAAMAAAVADSSRFSVFDLAEAILAQDIKRLQHIVHILHEEETALPLLVWALADLLRQLNTACFNQQHRQSNQALLARMPKPRQALFQQAVQRMLPLPPAVWSRLFQRLALLDQHSKGVGRDVSRSEQRLWDEVLDVALRLSGANPAAQRLQT
ncbi:MAG: DNA polymerase III subunit delta [Thiolinea sp.]